MLRYFMQMPYAQNLWLFIDIHQSQTMRSLKKPGVIINIGSAAGLYPMYADPIYSGTKGSYTTP
jgi:short-subunit dehydrogenase